MGEEKAWQFADDVLWGIEEPERVKNIRPSQTTGSEDGGKDGN